MSPYQPDFDIDLKWGQRQELVVLGVLSDIQNGAATVEVKSDAYPNSDFFLEVQDRRKGKPDYRDTGFRTSKAPLFVLNKPLIGVMFICYTQDLRDLERLKKLGPLIDGGTNGDCPTKGYKVTFGQLTGWISYLERKRGQLFGQEIRP
jgi:hypothetical protein